MNEYAIATARMLQDGTGNVLSSEHIETTRKAFPFQFDQILKVTVSADGTALLAIGTLGGDIALSWTNDKDEMGYEISRPKYEPPKPSRLQILMERISRAIRVLKGGEDETL